MDCNNTKNINQEIFTADLGNSITIWYYIVSYEETINIIYSSLTANSKYFISLPLLNLMRHTVELGIKANIKSISQQSQAKDCLKKIEDSHEIDKLYNCFKTHLDIFLKNKHMVSKEKLKEIKDDYNKLKTLIDLFVKIDPNAQGFRYPTNKKGEIIFDTHLKVNLLDIKKQFDLTMKVLKIMPNVIGQILC